MKMNESDKSHIINASGCDHEGDLRDGWALGVWGVRAHEGEGGVLEEGPDERPAGGITVGPCGGRRRGRGPANREVRVGRTGVGAAAPVPRPGGGGSGGVLEAVEGDLRLGGRQQ